MISFTDSDIESTISKEILNYDMYNNVYSADNEDCTNLLKNDHLPVTCEHVSNIHPACMVYQMEYNITKKIIMMRNDLYPRRKFNMSVYT